MPTPPEAVPHGPSPCDPAAAVAAPLAGPPLTALAELIHRATVDHPSDLVVTCRVVDGSVDFGFCPVPAVVRHPTEVLVGWRPVPGTEIVGLVTAGEARSDDAIEPVRVTVLTAASGRAATVLERAGGRSETLTDAPWGWGADALRRCLALPTPPPEHGLGVCVEGTWLAAVTELLRERAHRRQPVSWSQLARLHPLQRGGRGTRVDGAARLHAATTTLEAESSWERMLVLVSQSTARRFPNPAEGVSVPLHEWFDAGSFSRWSARQHPDLDDLLFEVLDQLPSDLAAELLDALVSVTA